MQSRFELPDLAAKMFQSAPGGIRPVRHFVRKGFDRREVAAWAATGLCDKLLHGVYGALAHDPTERRLHLPLIYLELRMGPTHHLPILTGPAALEAHGVPGLPPLQPTVLVDKRCTARLPDLPFTIRRVDLAGVPSEDVAGLRATPPVRALADTASTMALTPLQLRTTVDHLRNRGLLWMPAAVREWEQMPGPGAARLVKWARQGVFEQESEGERRAFELLFVPFPPVVDCQVVLVGNLRADFVYLSAALVIEYYGEVHDGSANEDATRVDVFEELGYRVKVVTKSLLHEAPRVAAQIQDIRHDREHRIRTGALPLPTLPPQPERLHPLRTFYRAAA